MKFVSNGKGDQEYSDSLGPSMTTLDLILDLLTFQVMFPEPIVINGVMGPKWVTGLFHPTYRGPITPFTTGRGPPYTTTPTTWFYFVPCCITSPWKITIWDTLRWERVHIQFLFGTFWVDDFRAETRLVGDVFSFPAEANMSNIFLTVSKPQRSKSKCLDVPLEARING